MESKVANSNVSVIEKSYAPASWHFVDSKKPEDKYTYKTFTVKGYYSPVTINEIKEKKNGKIYVETSREDPRCFTLNLRDRKYDIVVKYLDENGKEVLLSKENDITGIKNYRVPNLNRSTKVTFKITGSNLKDKKLSNWKYVDNKYITNSYVLKPERAY